MQLAKYNVYRYIGCITDQSNWSGPFSLVVMTPIRNPEAVGSNPGRGTRLEVFIYRSISPPTTFKRVISHWYRVHLVLVSSQCCNCFRFLPNLLRFFSSNFCVDISFISHPAPVICNHWTSSHLRGIAGTTFHQSQPRAGTSIRVPEVWVR